MKRKLIFYAAVLALGVSCSKESYIEGITVAPASNNPYNGNMSKEQITQILCSSGSARMWITNPNGKTVYCNNGTVNPPLAMDDIWTFVADGRFSHYCGTVSVDNATHCGDGGNYQGTWSVSADNKSIILNGSVKKLFSISDTRLVVADGDYQDDLVPKQ